MSAIVSIQRCSSYEAAESALQACLEELGGMRTFIRPGARTLLKINLVSGNDESRAVTTHPAIVAAAIQQIRTAGGIPFVGDSPALASAQAVARTAGIARVCEEQRVTIVNLDEPVLVANPGARLVRAFRLSAKLRQFDAIVSIPKLKTHCLVGMSGAVKNLFGCIPGKLKTAHHLVQQDPAAFAEMLLDLHDTIAPDLTIVDAVVGMEGPGPGAGDPRSFGVVIAGRSAIAVDTVCARILGLTDREVPTLRLASSRAIPGAAIETIEVRGQPIRDVAIHDLKKPRASATTYLPRFVMDLGKRYLTAGPAVYPGRCVVCGDCLSICAARAITMTPLGPRFESARCIRCYCCHEICRARAITLKGSILSGLLDSGVRTP